jgi:hypothetical protein
MRGGLARGLAVMALTALLIPLVGCGRDQARADFMDGCVQGGASASICKCIFGKMEGDLRAMHASQRVSLSDEAGQRLVQATATCLRD